MKRNIFSDFIFFRRNILLKMYQMKKIKGLVWLIFMPLCLTAQESKYNIQWGETVTISNLQEGPYLIGATEKYFYHV